MFKILGFLQLIKNEKESAYKKIKGIKNNTKNCLSYLLSKIYSASGCGVGCGFFAIFVLLLLFNSKTNKSIKSKFKRLSLLYLTYRVVKMMF